MALQGAKSGGGHGMLSYWKDTVIHILKKEVSVSAGKRNLAHTLSGFIRTDKNIQKEKSLLESLDKYLKSHEKNRFSIVAGARAIRWNIIESVRLTGFTPIAVAKPDKTFASYFFLEDKVSWQSEIRFPILQSYLAHEVLQCDINNLEIGVYCLKTDSFYFKRYTMAETAAAIAELGTIFKTVNNVYEDKKRRS